MAGTNMKRGGAAHVWFSEPVNGRALVVAADVMADRSEWLVVVAFEVGGSDIRLVGHNVMRCPAEWPAQAHVLTQGFASLFAPSTSDAHLTTAIVRSAATTELEMFVRGLLNHRVLAQGETYAEKAWGDRVDPGMSEKRTGPRRRGDLHRARVARRYVELLSDTKQTARKPKVALAGELCVSVNTVNSYLHDARMRGLLTSAGQGRTGGQLTPLALSILEGEDD